MAVIKPFKGLLYNMGLVGKIEDVVAPPYDVITLGEQYKLYRKHVKNIIRLILGREYKTDCKENNRYTRAKRLFEKWQKDGVLLQDEKPSFYYYTQEYSLSEGIILKRKGFIALLKIADFDEGIVLRHEKTLSQPLGDRVNLIKECRANFSPIFMLYSDRKGKIAEHFNTFVKGESYFDFTDMDGVTHRLWKIDNEKLISDIKRLFRRKVLIIADGHHRYSASIKFRNYIRKRLRKGVSESSFDYAMVYLTCMEDKGLSILPIHRLVHSIKSFEPQTILKKLSLYFNIEIFPFKRKNIEHVLFRLKKEMSEYIKLNNVFSLYFRSDDRFYLLKAHEDKVHNQLIKSGVSSELAKLDIIILHRLIFEKLFGITKTAQEKQQNIIYVKGDKGFNSIIKRKDYQVAFFLNPFSSVDIYKIVRRGEILPQKTTFFYPKIISGFVINKME